MNKWTEHLPEMVRGRAKSLGEAGERWLNGLDEMICGLEKRWGIRVTEVLEGGSHALIGLAETAGGEARILKIDLPDNSEQEYLQSVRMLESAKGRGYCTLFAYDAKLRAALLERLGERLFVSGFSPRKQMEIICAALRESWQMDVEALPTGGYDWFRGFIPGTNASLGGPCSERLIAAALAALDGLEQRTMPDEYVPVHGDAHNNNMLRVPGTEEYKFIDPDGIIFEKSYDLGVLMREWPGEFEKDVPAEVARRSEFLSSLTGVNSRDIRDWGLLQMTATALVLLQIGQNELGFRMIAIAEKWD